MLPEKRRGRTRTWTTKGFHHFNAKSTLRVISAQYHPFFDFEGLLLAGNRRNGQVSKPFELSPLVI